MTRDEGGAKRGTGRQSRIRYKIGLTSEKGRRDPYIVKIFNSVVHRDKEKYPLAHKLLPHLS